MANKSSLPSLSAFGPFMRRGRHGRATGAAGVTVIERANVAIASVAARKRQTAALAAQVAERTGLDLPVTPRLVTKDHISFLWTAPGQWLAMADGEDGTHFALELAQDLGALAAVTDQTDGRGIVVISGPHVRSVLAKGCMLDLDSRVFKVGDTAITPIALLTTQVTRIPDAAGNVPAFELAIMRSFAGNLWHWLESSSAEFGLQVA